MDDRISWTAYFMRIAEEVATRSTCLRRQVGAVAVGTNHRILGTGYNGAPSGMIHCTKESCVRIVNKIPSGQKLEMCKAIHAEQNLVLQLGEQLEDATIYCTTRPCTTCTKLLIGCRVREIVWKNDYNDPYANELLQEYMNNSIWQDPYGYYHAQKIPDGTARQS